ncbi:uncharacterized protein LOC116144861 [Pistacia vera]|uniref:uncharacterized protein LOC116144861 n=1 Tax=Pistacia vera TaxID=55513 RepID=UPI0012630E24|nr:uncharacterized protein LOC116144861 [Pistacia vera]
MEKRKLEANEERFSIYWRKSTPTIWIRIVVWVAYLSADWVATISLGNLATSPGNSDSNSSNNIAIQAFWAPFLLLHLGGPDTITAYSLEDNELWLRHLLGLLVQVVVAFYVFVWSWSKGALTFIAIPIFTTGIAKYGERTYALRSASTKQFKEALLSTNPFAENTMRMVLGITEDAFFERNIKMEGPREKLNELYLSRKQVGNQMDEAHFLFKRFVYLFGNLILGLNERRDCYSVICEKSAEDAFKLVAIELGFMYDVLYTKATLIYTRLLLEIRQLSNANVLSQARLHIMSLNNNYLYNMILIL